jgi:hypothetical protein
MKNFFFASLKSLKKVGPGSIIQRCESASKMSQIPNTDKKNSMAAVYRVPYLVECTHVEVQALVNPGPRLSILCKKNNVNATNASFIYSTISSQLKSCLLLAQST